MPSDIDATKPEQGSATTLSVRENFAAAKAEIIDLQAADTTINGRIDNRAERAGDLGGTATSSTVVAIQNRAVSGATPAPVAGQPLTWNATPAPGAWTPMNVAQLQGTAVSATAPTNGQQLRYTTTAPAGWAPATNTVAVSGDVTGTGDASAGAIATTVVQLQGRPVTGATPAPVANQPLTWNGTAWTPSNVTQLQGRTVSATAPSSGQALVYSGTDWVPTTAGAGLSDAPTDGYTYGRVNGGWTEVPISGRWGPNLLAGTVVAGAGWTQTSGSPVGGVWTHTSGTAPLAFHLTAGLPLNATIKAVWSVTNLVGGTVTPYLRLPSADGTVTTSQVNLGAFGTLSSGGTIGRIVTAAGLNMLVFVPATGFTGTLTVTLVQQQSLVQPTEIDLAGMPIKVLGSSIGIGLKALGPSFAPTTTGGSVAIGVNALKASTTQSYSVAVGRHALTNVTTSATCVGVGMLAGGRNTTGARTTAIGYYAGAVSAGVTAAPYVQTDNSYLGGYTAPLQVSGTLNTFVGTYGMYNATGGSNNVTVGCHAGRYYGATTSTMTGDSEQCTFIGAQSGQALAAGNLNQTAIGYFARCTANNQITLGNASVTQLRCQVTTITALSDARIKQNVQPANLDMCLDAVKAIPVRRYRLNERMMGERNDRTVTGFVADDVEKVFPHSITYSDERLGGVRMKKVKSLTNENALPTLWGAVQKIIERLDRIEEKLNG